MYFDRNEVRAVYLEVDEEYLDRETGFEKLKKVQEEEESQRIQPNQSEWHQVMAV